MRRTERWWGRVEAADPAWESCPLCGTPVWPVFWRHETMLPGHLTEGLVTCSGSGRTMEAARELAALRLRAHP